MQLNDEIIWCGQLTDARQIRTGTITKTKGAGHEALIWVDGRHKPEDCIYAAYCWPARVKDELITILTERERLQRAADDSMKLVYELRNAISRGEK
jgi:hypothetical protein